MKYKKIWIAFLLLSIFKICNCQDSIPKSPYTSFGQENLYKPFPRFIYRDINSHLFSNDSLKGKVTLINFWFKACEPCIIEFESLNILYQNLICFKNFRMLSFTFESLLEAKKIQAQYSLTFPIISVNQTSIGKLNFDQGFPTNIIVGKNKKITSLFIGGSTTPEYSKAFINTEILPQLIKLLNEN